MKKQSYKFRWSVNKYRRDKRTGVLSPVPRSEYAQYLFEKGAGWKDDQKRD